MRKVAKMNESMDDMYYKNEDRRDGKKILLSKTDQMLN